MPEKSMSDLDRDKENLSFKFIILAVCAALALYLHGKYGGQHRAAREEAAKQEYLNSLPSPASVAPSVAPCD